MIQGIANTSLVKNRTGIITSAGTLLAANNDRLSVLIQNLGTNTLFVKFGSGASTSDFDIILNAGGGNDDGLGGIFAEDTLSYTGIITIAGTSPRCTATEF